MLVRAVREWPEIWAPPPPPPPRETAESAVKESEGEGEEEQDEGRILDLSCGSGEVTAALVAAGVSIDRIDACDPYTVRGGGGSVVSGRQSNQNPRRKPTTQPTDNTVLT